MQAPEFLDADDGVRAFAFYVAEYPEEIKAQLPDGVSICLLDYLNAWLWQGCTGTTGILTCRNDFGLFLAIVALAINHWHTDPTFGHKELEHFKNFTRIDGEDARHPVFNPRNFQQAWFNWEHVYAVRAGPSCAKPVSS
ncbi:hypothetical protein OG806_08225 [Streptomyces sp. NBC_00882]|uniref:hypothetical protein n=1 Tax=Streptomyces sp. NBC_00882 TaxID=2975856 RepID=UPI003868946C|nr:hypothetical protein OG806_08225 [Streptomyces sp. NBC_00882]